MTTRQSRKDQQRSGARGTSPAGREAGLDPGGLAALSICESLLISLAEKGVLDHDEACFVLEDALDSHQQAIDEGGARAAHEAAAQLIRLIIANSNSVRGAC